MYLRGRNGALVQWQFAIVHHVPQLPAAITKETFTFRAAIFKCNLKS